MLKKPKVLFWLNGVYLHYSLAYYLQKKIDGEFFGIVDINSKPKKFFQEQNLVNFKKMWYYHDFINTKSKNIDIDYLLNFEKKYKLDLWKYALNERFFYLHNPFYKFTKNEILAILEQELKLFESILDEINPDYFLTYNPVFHPQLLLLEMCRAKQIKVLSMCGATVNNLSILVENGATFDLDSNAMASVPSNSQNSNPQVDLYNADFKEYLKGRNPNVTKKITALKDYLSTDDSDLIKSNYQYYGRSKSKVFLNSLLFEYNKFIRYRFLQKNSIIQPDLNTPFVYFPMNIDEEMNLLHYAPFFTNQIEVIRHVAKSIPIDHVLYVKDHIASKLRGWKKIDYYKELLDIPNLKLIHPLFDNDELVKKSKLIVTIRGTSALKAVKFGKPSILFGEEPFQIIPSIFTVKNLNLLPELIKEALHCNVNSEDYKKYETVLSSRTFRFNMYDYELTRNQHFWSGGIHSNVLISEKDMLSFLENNEEKLSDLTNAHIKSMSKN